MSAPIGGLNLAELGFDEGEIGAWVDADYVGFSGSDGKLVRAYDDIVLSRPIPVSGGNPGEVSEVGVGTICTVLMYSQGVRPIAYLECYVDESSFCFGFEELACLKLHMTNEEKYPR